MKMNLFLILIVFFSANLLAQSTSKPKPKLFVLPQGATSKDYVSNTAIIKLKNINYKELISINSQEIKSLKIKSATITTVKQIFPNSKELDDKFGLRGIIEIKYSSKAGIEQIINEIQKNSNVKYAVPKYIGRELDNTRAARGSPYVNKIKSSSRALPYINECSFLPNDPILKKQNYLNQIQAYEAWKVPLETTAPVIIAIIDDGTELDHEDLADNIYHWEKDPIDGEDNDGDGYTDNYNGWNFVDNNNNPRPKVGDFHGTHVAGLAAAVTGNKKGIASVAGVYAKLMIIRNNLWDDNYEEIKYAADHGAKIINCSWTSGFFSQADQDVIDDAVSRGCLIVAAAGNKGDRKEYPASYNGVFAVAGVDASDKKANFSFFGSNVSIAAPSIDIYSTLPNNQYGPKEGTSMATPIVSSAAALLWARFPSWTAQQIINRLKATADPIDHLNPQYASQLGAGRLNIYRALTEGLKSQSLTITSSNTIARGSTLIATVTRSVTDNEGGRVLFSIQSGSGSATVDPHTGLITPIIPGTITLYAGAVGDDKYNGAKTCSILTIDGLPQTLTLTSENTVPLDGSLQPKVTRSLTNGQGGALSFAVEAGSGFATIDATTGLLTPKEVGTISLIATVAGDATYCGAITSIQITITKASLSFNLKLYKQENAQINTFILWNKNLTIGDKIKFEPSISIPPRLEHTLSFKGIGLEEHNDYYRASKAGRIITTFTVLENSNYNSASGTLEIIINKITPKLTILSRNSMKVGRSLLVMSKLERLDSSYPPYNPKLVSSYQIEGVGENPGEATVNSKGIVSATRAGLVKLTMRRVGDDNYNEAIATQEITIEKLTPNLTIISANKISLNETLQVKVNTSTQSGKGGVISYKIESIPGEKGEAIVDDQGLLTAIHTGKVRLTVTLVGDENYNEANATQEISIEKLTPNLTITSANKVSLNETLQVKVNTSAKSGEGGIISYKIESMPGRKGGATVNNQGLLIATHAGKVRLTVISAGDENYNEASATQEITIEKLTPILSISLNKTIVPVAGHIQSTVNTNAKNNQGGTISYKIESIPGEKGRATVNDQGLLTATHAGKVRLTGTSTGDDNYHSVNVSSQVITIEKATPQITIYLDKSEVHVGEKIQASVASTASNGRGGNISYRMISADGLGQASVDLHGPISASRAGKVTLLVTSAGDEDYHETTSNKTFTINL